MCARYIKSMLEGTPLIDLQEQIAALQTNGAEHFFDPKKQEIFPEIDFWMCMKNDKFPFVVEIEKDDLGFVSVKKEVNEL